MEYLREYLLRLDQTKKIPHLISCSDHLQQNYKMDPNTANNLSHNATVPTTIGALLTEENTIDPLSHLPSFLELTFIDVARNSGRVALSAAWDMCVVYLRRLEERLAKLEQIMIHRVTHIMRERLPTSNAAAVRRIVASTIARLRLCYYKRIRKACNIMKNGLKCFAPELQSLIMFAVDYHCIHYLAGSTGCEMVYGLKRSKIVNMSNALSMKEGVKIQQKVFDLSSSDKTKSAALAAILPYWKERLDKLYSNLREQNNTQQHSNATFSENSSYQHVKDLFLKIYPYLHLTHEGSIFLYQFAYLLEYTPYWSFSLHALRVILRRITVADFQDARQRNANIRHHEPSTKHHASLPRSEEAAKHGISTNFIDRKSTSSKMTIPHLLRGMVLCSVSYTLVSGWYRYFQRQLSLRRRRWIAGAQNQSTAYHRQNTRNDGIDRLERRNQHPIPPPPLPPVTLKHTKAPDDEENWACPLCHEPRINPTASTSGYVFCYKCLVSKLRQDGEYCPLTGMSCKVNEIVRLYESTAPRLVGDAR